MTEQINGPQCAGCGAPTARHEAGQQRQPCLSCGSSAHTYAITIAVLVTARASLTLKARRAGAVRPFLECKAGSSLFRKLGTWLHLERTIDREGDHYHEVVHDPTTGELVHYCDEPLSQHRHHGSARVRRVEHGTGASESGGAQ